MHKIKQLLRTISLGASWRDKVILVTSFIYLRAKRVLVQTANPTHAKRRVRLAYGCAAADYLLESLIDFDILREILIEEVYKPDQALSENSIIFDLGSNKGISVLYFLANCPRSHVYAFEPDPRNLETLRMVAGEYGDRVSVIEKAISNGKVTTVTLYYADDLHWSSSLYARKKTVNQCTVPSTSLDDAMEELSVTSIDLLKFDIEGAEYAALGGFQNANCAAQYIGEMHYEFNTAGYELQDLFPEHHITCRAGDIVSCIHS